MLSSAEISVVETLGSPKRLNSSSVTSRMRSAVRRGFFGGGAIVVSYVSGGESSTSPRVGGKREKSRLPTIARSMPAISFQNVSKSYSAAGREVRALDGVSFDI